MDDSKNKHNIDDEIQNSLLGEIKVFFLIPTFEIDNFIVYLRNTTISNIKLDKYIEKIIFITNK